MSRRLRAYLPGMTFHLTARTQGHVPWVDPELRPTITEIIKTGVRRTDARLLAYAVMPTHLHLVVVQGADPLGRLMQAVLRRVALLIRRTHGTEGHVFERRFSDSACTEPLYIRNAIVYTHLNPVRAGIIDEPIDYAWSSHRAYCQATSPPDSDAPTALDVEAGLRFFATGPQRAAAGLRADYLRFIDWRIAMDRYLAAADRGTRTPAPPPPPPAGEACAAPAGCRNGTPTAPTGDTAPGVGPATRERAAPELDPDARPPRPDLRDLALKLVGAVRPQLDLEWIRGPYGGPDRVRIRRQLIRQATRLGYRGVEIARFLRISEATVSRVVSALHRQRVPR